MSWNDSFLFLRIVNSLIKFRHWSINIVGLFVTCLIELKSFTRSTLSIIIITFKSTIILFNLFMEIHSFINYPTHPQQAYPNQVAFLTTVHYVTTGAFCSKISYHLVTTTGLTCTFASVEFDCHYCSWFEKFFDTTLHQEISRNIC